jgi:uncharacterized membrane protein YeaQ/YmgE (transglycosylase-associated protein family)
MKMLGFILTVVVAVLIGWAGDALAKNKMPGGFWGASLAGMVGAWIGAYFPYFNASWPRIFGIAIVPTILGAAVFAFLLGLFKIAYQQAS